MEVVLLRGMWHTGHVWMGMVMTHVLQTSAEYCYAGGCSKPVKVSHYLAMSSGHITFTYVLPQPTVLVATVIYSHSVVINV